MVQIPALSVSGPKGVDPVAILKHALDPHYEVQRETRQCSVGGVETDEPVLVIYRRGNPSNPVLTMWID
jgi:hypothetical protein